MEKDKSNFIDLIKSSKYTLGLGAALYFLGFIILSLANSKYNSSGENLFDLKYIIVAILFLIFALTILFLFKNTLELLISISKEKNFFLTGLYFISLNGLFFFVGATILMIFNLRTSIPVSMPIFSFDEIGKVINGLFDPLKQFGNIGSFLKIQIDPWVVLVMCLIIFATLIFSLAIDVEFKEEKFFKKLLSSANKVLNSFTKLVGYFGLFIMGCFSFVRTVGYVKDQNFFVQDKFEALPIVTILIGTVFVLYLLGYRIGMNTKERDIIKEDLQLNSPIRKLFNDFFIGKERTSYCNVAILAVVLAVVVIFSHAFYRYIPSYILGGQLKPVNVEFTSEMNVKDCNLFLIENTQSSVFVWETCKMGSKTVEIPRNFIENILYK